ncbi:NAD-dependent DNA ligase [Clostridium sp. MF28]|uniref:BRCT domain-containing protein n=1 Tax=Clostridium TaxID=1485 RepID=UPI000CF9FBD6|nr:MULTISPECIES: BRCT domain-containing protein [Clostridium]AVK49925.1 NAD-dependent DNA ligase [Clostridium sp. MF28]PSM59707.1 NAD-dependent DNA ligase [Clostridium diolis]
MLDYDKQEYRKYTGKSERDKYLNVLKGILTGITSDDEITNNEIEELTNWCSLLADYANDKPFDEILQKISEALSDNILTLDEVSDIIWVIDKHITKSQNNYYDPITHGLQQLQGIMHGILADNVVDDSEIERIKLWIQSHDFLVGYYPYDEVSSLLTSILSDKVITDDEKNILKVYFSEFVDSNSSIKIDFNEIENLKNDYTVNGICSVCPEIDFNNKTFCFTGASTKATRKDFETLIPSLGGTFSKNITKKTDYLIIGGNGNTCWAYSCYGRKVEQAINLRQNGSKIIIIHENDFWDAVEDFQ